MYPCSTARRENGKHLLCRDAPAGGGVGQPVLVALGVNILPANNGDLVEDLRQLATEEAAQPVMTQRLVGEHTHDIGRRAQLARDQVDPATVVEALRLADCALRALLGVVVSHALRHLRILQVSNDDDFRGLGSATPDGVCEAGDVGNGQASAGSHPAHRLTPISAVAREILLG